MELKKSCFYGILFLFAFILPYFAKAQGKTSYPTANASYHYKNLVWQDEFNGGGLPDPAKWKYDTGYLRNNELQYYTWHRTENALIHDGLLDIVARNDSFKANGKIYPITSADLSTEGLKDFVYGRIEVRARIPSSLGSWPAFWTLGSNISQVGWPACGEIDIMEHVGYMPDTLHFNEHAAASNQGTRIFERSPDADFHIYAVEWFPDRIDWFFDNRKVFTFANDHSGTASWPFDKPQFIILNLAFGGDWGGSKGVAIGSLPLHYYIDWVRVYQ